MTNETITLSNRTGMEIDFNRITYTDGNTDKPRWFTAHIAGGVIRSLCGKGGNGCFSVTEDELEAALAVWLATEMKAPIASFKWIWDTYTMTATAA